MKRILTSILALQIRTELFEFDMKEVQNFTIIPPNYFTQDRLELLWKNSVFKIFGTNEGSKVKTIRECNIFY